MERHQTLFCSGVGRRGKWVSRLPQNKELAVFLLCKTFHGPGRQWHLILNILKARGLNPTGVKNTGGERGRDAMRERLSVCICKNQNCWHSQISWGLCLLSSSCAKDYNCLLLIIMHIAPVLCEALYKEWGQGSGPKSSCIRINLVEKGEESRSQEKEIWENRLLLNFMYTCSGLQPKCTEIPTDTSMPEECVLHFMM